MSSLTSEPTSRLSRGALDTWRRIAVSVCVVVAVAGCTSSAATSGASPSVTVASVTATPAPIAAATATATTATATSATATLTPTLALAPTPAPTAAPVKTPAPPAATQKPTPTPLPALAIGLCTGAQLSLSISSWVGDPGAGTVYAHVTATNVSSASCNMRGTSRAQILDGSGNVIADAGSGGAAVSASDPITTLAPNDSVIAIVGWGNWCTTPPAQNLKVAMIEPFGLGRSVAPAAGVAPVPTCYASGSPTVVSSQAWS